MQAILFCDKMTSCIPVQDCPEALLPFCNEPLLARLLRCLERSGFEAAILLGADSRTQRMLDGLRLHMPVRAARSLRAVRSDTPSLLLRRLCIPDWEMGELYALCGKEPVRLFRQDGSAAGAELYPAGAVFLEPERTAIPQHAQFLRADNPGSYRTIQQALLAKGTERRIAEGCVISKEAFVDAQTVIGADCVIGAGARLTGCILGDGVQVGAGAVLENCVICRRALVDRNARMQNGTVPEGAFLPEDGLPQRRSLQLLPEDGICFEDPRWNTPAAALRAGAALTVLSESIAVGYSDPAGESLAMAAASGAVSQGAKVWYAGACVLSQLAAIGNLTGCEAYLWAGGSGIVRLLPYGKNSAALTSSQTERLQRALDAEVAEHIREEGVLSDAGGLLPLWEAQCRALVPAKHPVIRVSCGAAALRQAGERIFAGGESGEITLTLTSDGTGASAFSLESGMLCREQLLLIAALSVAEQGEPLILPQDFHPAAEAFAMREGVRILREHPASVTAAELAARQGLLRDGVRLFAHVLRVLDSRGLTLAQAAALLPAMHTVRRTAVTSLSRQQVEALKRYAAPHMSIVLPPHSRLVRVQAHGDSMEAAAELCSDWEKHLREYEKTGTDTKGK
ncbi:MAG: hypothetical protein K5695_13250 [Oscillospiraceae bacterium]|nr:hypothetical protein [Oscillospiraceae bacterium]